MLGLALDMFHESMEGQLDRALHRAVGYKSGLQDRGSSKEMDLQVAHIEMMIRRHGHGGEKLPKGRK